MNELIQEAYTWIENADKDIVKLIIDVLTWDEEKKMAFFVAHRCWKEDNNKE